MELIEQTRELMWTYRHAGGTLFIINKRGFGWYDVNMWDGLTMTEVHSALPSLDDCRFVIRGEVGD